jgi:hypothetical protein
VSRVSKVRQVYKAPRALREIRGTLALLVRKVTPARLDQQDLRAILETPALKVTQETKALRVSRERLGLPVHKVHRV